MPTFLREQITVPFDSLYLDPNNPRLAMDDPPGYEDPTRLFDPDLQKRLEGLVEKVYDVGALEQAIVGQGWMGIDNIVVWTYPTDPTRHVVVEGNTRTVALRRVRARLPREQEKLRRMQGGRRQYTPRDVSEQEEVVAQLERIIADTANLPVLPLDAGTIDELNLKLPRVLAVRHITGAKPWGNYAEDVWLMARYEHLFEEAGLGDTLRWDPAIIARVGAEASLGKTQAKRKLKASSCFSHFKREFEDRLPEGEEFSPKDYYLFEIIVAKPWLREKFGLGEDDFHLAAEAEEVLFKWTFQLPGRRIGDDNPNVFYRQENLRDWEKIQRYDEQHGTSFAKRLDIDDPDNAPRYREVEADYLAHQTRRRPADLLEQLLGQLGSLNTDTIVNEGAFLRAQLERLHQRTGDLIAMIDAVEHR